MQLNSERLSQPKYRILVVILIAVVAAALFIVNRLIQLIDFSHEAIADPNQDIKDTWAVLMDETQPIPIIRTREGVPA